MPVRSKWQSLPTEAINPGTLSIDKLSPADIVEEMLGEDRRMLSAVQREKERIAVGIEIVTQALRKAGRIIFVGAGTSGRLGVLESAEMPPTFGTHPDLVHAIMAGGKNALLQAKEGVEDDYEEGARAINRLKPTRKDVVIGVSASGMTSFVRGALTGARRAGSKIIFVTCDPRTELQMFVDLTIAPAVGPEVIAGSTRLKAGTATKLVLNMLTTGSMIRIGKTYGNLMVDVQVGSEKRKDRARRIIAIVTGLEPEEAEKLLRRANWNVKAAIVMQKSGLSYTRAVSRLRKSHDFIRDAIGEDIEGRLKELLRVEPRSTARALLTKAIADRVCPAAVAEVGDRGRPLWRCASGTLTFDEGAPPADEATIFDLASLTKPLATATLAMRLVASGGLRLGDTLAAAFEEWRGEDREAATVRDLLEHASGLAARFVDQPPEGRREFEHDICRMRLEYKPRSRSVYSDLGFILLGFLVEDRAAAPLGEQFNALLEQAIGAGLTRHAEDDVRSDLLGFGVPAGLRARAAPTWPMDEDLRRGRLLAGEVHDNYAAALGGTAGHAGLFGTAGALGALARVILRGTLGDASVPAPFAPPIVLETIRKSTVPGSSRALGWDTMLPTSSCGSRMSPAAFGHVGFTGTSLWIDPILDRYFILLTNRVCRGGTLSQMRDVRRAFHDVASEIE